MTISQVQRARVKGIDLTYLQEGKGQSIIFVHGYFGDYRSWFSQVRFFSRTYRSVAHSLRYNYPYKGSAENSDVVQKTHTDDLAGLIEKLGLKPAHVVGSSYGGVIALRLARYHPEFVRSLTLGEPGLLSWLKEIPAGSALLEQAEERFADPAKKAALEGNMDKALRFVTDGFVGPNIYDHLPEAARQAFLDNAHLIASYNFSDMFSRDDAEKIQAPTLLLTGDLSPRMYIMIADELARHLRDVERGKIMSAAHMLASFNPDAFNETVLKFLSRTKIGN